MSPLDADIIVICDGMADEPGHFRALPSALGRLLTIGHESLVDNVPADKPVSSEIAIATILGANSSDIPGRGALEALGLGVDPHEGILASRFDFSDRTLSPASGHDILIRLSHLLPDGYELIEGRGFRHILLRNQDCPEISFPDVRIWGEAPLPATVPQPDSRIMVAGAPVVRGLARFLGWRIPMIPDATGGIDTDYRAKSSAAINFLSSGVRRICVHVEAPDEASHLMRPDLKKAVIDNIDSLIIAPLVDYAVRHRLSLAVMPDHATSPHSGSHLRGPVSVIFYNPC